MKSEGKQKGMVGVYAKQLLLLYIITGVLLLILSFVLYKWDLNKDQLQIGIYIVYVLVNFLGGWLIGKKYRTRRFVWGAISGVCYFLILFFVSIVLNQGIQMNLPGILWALAACILGGMAGGMLS